MSRTTRGFLEVVQEEGRSRASEGAPPSPEVKGEGRPGTAATSESPRERKGVIQQGDLPGSLLLGPCGSGPGPGDVPHKAVWHLHLCS